MSKDLLGQGQGCNARRTGPDEGLEVRSVQNRRTQYATNNYTLYRVDPLRASLATFRSTPPRPHRAPSSARFDPSAGLCILGLVEPRQGRQGLVETSLCSVRRRVNAMWNAMPL